MRRLALILLLLPAACGGGNNTPEPALAANQQSADNSADNLRRALELRDRAKEKMEAGDYSASAELAEQAVKLAPDEPTVHDQLGFAYQKLLRYEDALASYSRALELFKGKHNPWTQSNAAWCAHTLAQMALHKSDTDAALKHVKRAIELRSGDAALFQLKGDILYRRQDFEAAAEAYGVAADFAVGSAVYEALLKKGESQFHAGAYRPAIETFSRIINDGVEGHEAYGWRAYCWFQVGQKPEAESDFNQAALRTTDDKKRAEYEAALKALAEVK